MKKKSLGRVAYDVWLKLDAFSCPKKGCKKIANAVAREVRKRDKENEITCWQKKHAKLCGITLKEYRREFPLKGKKK